LERFDFNFNDDDFSSFKIMLKVVLTLETKPKRLKGSDGKVRTASLYNNFGYREV